jgi:hypothetical protein
MNNNIIFIITKLGYLTDLNPKESNNGSISYSFSNNKDSIIIKYKNIIFFGGDESNSNTFSITLSKDGSIYISYNKIYLNRMVEMNHKEISGMRIPDISNNFSIMNTYITKEQIDIGLFDWNTNVYGVYPMKSQVINGSSFISCPVSTTWCLHPSYIDINLIYHNDVNITLTPLSMSCTSSIEYSIYILPNNETENIDFPNKILYPNQKNSTCIYIKNGKSINCEINSLTTNITIGEKQVWIYWKYINDTNYNLLEIDPIIMNFYNSSISNPLLNSDIQVCATNEVINYTSSNCDNCTICNLELNCLELDCLNSSFPILYEYKNCDGLCPSSTIPKSNYYYIESEVFNATCCGENEFDCLGLCNGENYITYENNNFDSEVCCNKNNIDCLGICNGITPRDVCGICNGTLTDGYECNSSVSFNNFPNDFYPIVNSDKLWNITELVITNESNETNITISLSILGRSSNAPDILVNEMSHVGVESEIKPNSSMSFMINTSLESLYYGSKSVWEVKEIRIRYSRSLIFDFQYVYSIYIHPSMTNCSYITNKESCVRVPSCIFCFNYNGIRILQEINEEENEINYQNFQELEEKSRSLYTVILPNQLSPLLVNTFDEGLCIDGYLSNDCSLINGALSIKRINIKIISLFIILSSVMLLIN